MDYLKRPKYHYKPRKGWVNDPNGLVFFDGYYHVFYQHNPNAEKFIPPIHWGHARTKDFIKWEELPIALYPDMPYDSNGCWSGTATVKDDTLYLFYASVCKTDTEEYHQTVSVAYSKDGVNFEKYENNPVIRNYPSDGGVNFRDPAVACIDGSYYIVMATGNDETKTGRLLLYKSDDMFNWSYEGIMSEWSDCRFTECPSFVKVGDRYILSASVCPLDGTHYFSIMSGSFDGKKFIPEISAETDKGPDQYAGQIFADDKGRALLISWIPGWSYAGKYEKDVGCMSVPREIIIENGSVRAFPAKEIVPFLSDSDPAVKLTEDGFVVAREGREPVVYKGSTDGMKILRDEHIVEIFVRGGEEVYTALL